MQNQFGPALQQDVPEYLNRISAKVIGAAIEVHRFLGPGFFERTYEDALAIELGLRGIRFERQVPIPILYREQRIADCVVDLLVEDELVVELKAIEQIGAVHRAQVLSYLKAGTFQLGLVINFNVKILKDGVARVVRMDP